MLELRDGTRRTLFPPVTPPQPWAASTAYVIGEQVVNGSNVYTCDQAGTSASSGGPTGTGANITDGTARWDYTEPVWAMLAHVTFNGSILVDPLNTWTVNGTVPMVTTGARTRHGAGPFTDANFYSLGSGSDVLDTGAGWMRGLVFSPAHNSGTRVVYNNRTAAPNNGDHVIQGSGCSAFFNGVQLSPAGSVTVGALHVFCWGHDGTNAFAVLDTNAVATAAQAWTGGTGQQARIGKHNSDGFAFTGTLYEFFSCSQKATAARLQALVSAARSRIST